MPLYTNNLTRQDLASWEATCQFVREAAEFAAKHGMSPAQFRDIVHRACREATYNGKGEG